MQRVGKNIRIWALIFLIISSTLVLNSCGYSANAKAIENMLKDKYGKEFEVTELNNITPGGKGINYDAICYPKDNKRLLFEVSVYNDGEEMKDEYECALLGEAMKKDAAPIINRIAEDYEICMDFTSYADGFREGMSAKEFNSKNKCMCYTTLVINTDKKSDVEPYKLYRMISDMYREWGNTSGGIYLLLADADEMIDIREQLSRKARIDSGVLDACDTRFNSAVNNGVMTKTLNDMTNELSVKRERIFSD